MVGPAQVTSNANTHVLSYGLNLPMGPWAMGLFQRHDMNVAKSLSIGTSINKAIREASGNSPSFIVSISCLHIFLSMNVTI